ncbi:site-specific recombinase XerD [Paenibacillus shirakamiensis]|uniref:Site-specific recombinase XerD n=1 Tax=Paenibacillus shirakamiensis TaxID=1265935 RepID=A0ABS4JCL1_9BACL|nr:tyrosine-type recombinase/integrase [Paenibacillus shirakamiensis]MBP1999458.1 site-specific recombinase XerD [Paenibacillus shirakamiensis]
MPPKQPKFAFVSKGNRPVKIDLEKQITHFIDSKRIEKRSPKTISAYFQVLEQFRKWFVDTGEKEISSEILRKYIGYLTSEKIRWDDYPTSPNGGCGLSARTVNNVIRNMRIFLNYLMKERIISHSPMNAVNYQIQNKETFEIFTDEEVTKLLGSPNLRVYTGRRDFCMMLVLIDGGLRIKEMTSLLVSDIDFKLRQVTIRAEIAKTRTTRIVPLSQRTIKEIEKLISYMDL